MDFSTISQIKTQLSTNNGVGSGTKQPIQVSTKEIVYGGAPVSRTFDAKSVALAISREDSQLDNSQQIRVDVRDQQSLKINQTALMQQDFEDKGQFEGIQVPQQQQELLNNIALRIPIQKIFRQPTFSTGHQINMQSVLDNIKSHNEEAAMYANNNNLISGGGKIFQIRRLSQGATPTQGAAGNLKINSNKYNYANPKQLLSNFDDHSVNAQHQLNFQHNHQSSFLDKFPGSGLQSEGTTIRVANDYGSNRTNFYNQSPNNNQNLQNELVRILQNSKIGAGKQPSHKSSTIKKRQSNSRVSQGQTMNTRIKQNSLASQQMNSSNMFQGSTLSDKGFNHHTNAANNNANNYIAHQNNQKVLSLAYPQNVRESAADIEHVFSQYQTEQFLDQQLPQNHIKYQTSSLDLNNQLPASQNLRQVNITKNIKPRSAIRRNCNSVLVRSLSRNKSLHSSNQSNNSRQKQTFLKDVYLQSVHEDKVHPNGMVSQKKVLGGRPQSGTQVSSMVRQLKKIYALPYNTKTMANSPLKSSLKLANVSKQDLSFLQTSQGGYLGQSSDVYDNLFNESLMISNNNPLTNKHEQVNQQYFNPRKFKIARPNSQQCNYPIRHKRTKSVMSDISTPKNSEKQHRINNERMMNLLLDDNDGGLGGDIIFESPEGENQQTFHREDQMAENFTNNEKQLLIDDYQQQLPQSEMNDLSTFKSDQKYNQSFLQDNSIFNLQNQQPSSVNFMFPNPSEIVTTQALCQKLITLFAEKTSIEAQLQKEKAENQKLILAVADTQKLKAILELRDREIKKLEIDNQNKKQAKKRLKQQLEAMKSEIEKERQQMFKEFKEMQDNFYSMNKKTLNMSNTTEGNQNGEAPIDVFLKRLTKSSISQKHGAANYVPDMLQFNSRSPISNNEIPMTPIVGKISTPIEESPNKSQNNNIQITAYGIDGEKGFERVIQSPLKRQTLQIPETHYTRHQTQPIMNISDGTVRRLANKPVESDGTEAQILKEINQRPNPPQHSVTLEGDYLIAYACDTTNNQAPDSRSSFSISTINARINNQSLPPPVQQDIQIQQLDLPNNEPQLESRSFLISKFKENISNSDNSQHNQGSGRPQINISMGIGQNKLINNSSQIEEEEEKTPTNSSQQEVSQVPVESPPQAIIPPLKQELSQNPYLIRPKTITPVITPLNSGGLSLEVEPGLVAGVGQSDVVENGNSIKTENQLTRKVIRANQVGNGFVGYGQLLRQNTFINTDSGKNQLAVAKLDSQGIPILQRQFTKINQNDILQNGGPSLMQANSKKSSGSQTLHDLLRVRTMKQASEMATKSMDGIYNTLTNSFIEQMTMREEHLTERCLVEILSQLKALDKTFIGVFGPIVYDVKENNTQYENNKTRFVTIENQYILDQDLFETMSIELQMTLNEDTKRSLVQYLGRKYRKDTIMFEYQELERLTMIAHQDPGDRFAYLTGDGNLDLTELNSKSFRLINRIKDYMAANNMTLYSQLFQDGMIKVSKIKQVPLIQIDDFYNRLQFLQIRKSRDKIEPLTRFLIQDFRKMYLKVDLLAKLVDLSKQGNTYMLSFGTRKRRLPEHLKSTMYRDMELQKKKIVEEDEEESIVSQSSFLKSTQTLKEDRSNK